MSSLLRKRRRASSQDDDFRIKTAAGDPIPCRSLLVRTFSTCVEQLPAGADEWDVSGFLIEGEPFSREAVKTWLNCGNCMVYGKGELDTEDQELLSTANGLHHVLRFAHAVDSPEGLLNAACSKLQELTIEVQLPEDTFELPVCPADDCSYKFAWQASECRLVAHTLAESTEIGCASTSAHVAAIRRQVAVQTAGLLEVAHALHLKPLMDALHHFIFLSTRVAESVLDGALDKVFTDAVLEAALGSSTGSKEAYISSVLTQPFNLVESDRNPQGLVKLTGEFTMDSSTGRVTVQAQMLRNMAGVKAGQAVVVKLDMFNDDGLAFGLQLADDSESLTWFPARLLLGNSIMDEQLTLNV
jgi:hypothetical protein